MCKFFECDIAKASEAEVAFCLPRLLREQAGQKFFWLIARNLPLYSVSDTRLGNTKHASF